MQSGRKCIQRSEEHAAEFDFGQQLHAAHPQQSHRRNAVPHCASYQIQQGGKIVERKFRQGFSIKNYPNKLICEIRENCIL